MPTIYLKNICKYPTGKKSKKIEDKQTEIKLGGNLSSPMGLVSFKLQTGLKNNLNI
jgi:hypothetical protein